MTSQPPVNPRIHKRTGASFTKAGGAAGRKPKMGQHFLADAGAAEETIHALGDVSQRMVIEIGPGRGVMTSLLCKRAGRVIAVELDRKLTAQLRMDYLTRKNVEIIEADVLAIDFDNLVQGALTGVSGLKKIERVTADVVGNLPYYITSDILLKLFSFHHDFRTIVIMVQREVAERIAAQPRSRDYGLLTVTTQLYADIELLFTLPPTAFTPPPKVHSSVLRLRMAPKSQQLGVETAAFITFLKTCFAQKRKMLMNNLKAQYPDKTLRAAFQEHHISAGSRAEELSLVQLAALFKDLRPA